MLPQPPPPREREKEKKEKKNEMNPPPVDRLQSYLKFQ